MADDLEGANYAVNLVERATQYYTPVSWTQRPIVAGVLHDTETLDVATPHAGGSWHYQIGRDGRVWRDVLERHCAWHVRATDRWRPSWMVAAPISVSDANWCTLGVELVSHAVYREAGEPYTDAQYDALQELLADIQQRYPTIPWVAHGELQRDRGDPVAWDWQRAGFDDPVEGEGRYWLGGTSATEATQEENDDMTRAQELQAELDGLNGVNSELQRQVDALRQMLAAANSHLGAITVHELPALYARIADLEQQQADADTLAQLRARVDDLEARLRQIRELVAAGA